VMEGYSMIGHPAPDVGSDDLIKEVIEEDRALYRTLSGVNNHARRNRAAHLLRSDEVNRVDAMAEEVERGDMVLSLMDFGTRGVFFPVSYFSSRVMAREAFSICLASSRDRFKGFEHVEALNRDILDLSMDLNGIVGLSPQVTGTGNFIDVAHMIRHLAELTFRSGVINLDQADLLTTSKGGSMLVMTWGAARAGGDPAATSTKDALSNPLCDIDLSTVRRSLVNVIGSKDLTLEDSLVASDVLRKRVKHNCRIIWGVNIVEDMVEDMEVFLILATTPIELLTHWYSKQK
ncbi:MAG: hypothetical protein JW939_07635, partial [Candidatus Thermoplasmatota archaeon]|nr:hypothetical protein [Candidatus Thermoplasmatota archaeon]